MRALSLTIGKKTQTSGLTLEQNTCFEEISELKKAVKQVSTKKVFRFISEQLDLQKYCRSILLSTEDQAYVEDVDFDNLRAIINFKRLNYARDINEHLRAINKLLPDAGMYIGRVETYWERRKKIYKKYGKFFGTLIWAGDFIVNRAFARMAILDKIYCLATGGTFHELSKTEVLGRLFYCGFSMIETFSVKGLVYFSAIKIKGPSPAPPPSRRLLIKIPRMGKGGKIIGVYKFRTMHPYAEYLQDYIVRLNGYNEVGKPDNDWRVTVWGRWMRKLWLDEIPQVINVLKREMKIVGVRPISRFRFSEFPEHIQKLRIKSKPGCIPPYVALNMPDAKGNIEAELIYLNERESNPCAVDIRYFFKAVFNILTKRIRST
jgi:lipopolysaccharide/colanic/teichoic acid biosynthesis glycosyltransferase